MNELQRVVGKKDCGNDDNHSTPPVRDISRRKSRTKRRKVRVAQNSCDGARRVQAPPRSAVVVRAGPVRRRPERHEAMPPVDIHESTTSLLPCGWNAHDDKIAESFNIGNVAEDQTSMVNVSMENEQVLSCAIVERSDDNSLRKKTVVGDVSDAESRAKTEAPAVNDRTKHKDQNADEEKDSDKKVFAGLSREGELVDSEDPNRLEEGAELWKSLAASSVSSDDDLLKDTNGKQRGVCITLKGEECDVLTMLLKVFGLIENRLRRVQHYTENLLHYNLQSPGFPVQCGSDGYNLFSSVGRSWVLHMESCITSVIKNALVQIGYCSSDQDLEFYLSFLKSLELDVQPPHIDQKWENAVPPSYFPKKPTPRCYRGDYEEWVPFIAFFPLTEDGMTVEVWHARSQHEQPERIEHKVGRLVKIHLGEILLLRADVVHAGGFMTAESGNPRGHLYVYKNPRGASHPLHLSNCYDVAVDGNTLPMLNFYDHHPDCADANNVMFARLYGKG